MRDLPIKLIHRDRSRRRQALAILLISATPTLAEPPALVMPQSIPFNRATNFDGTQRIRSNPFCAAPTEGPVDPVQLASGAAKSSIRLKPIGKAIGLKSMENRNAESASASHTSPNSMTIESIPAQIQQNPLIDSVHRDNNPLEETELVEAKQASSGTDVKRGSTIVLRPVRPIVPFDESATKSSSDESRSITRRDAELKVTHDSGRVALPNAVKSESEAEVSMLNSLTADDRQPVHFSFSDRQDANDSNVSNATEATEPETADTVAAAIVAEASKVDDLIDLSTAPSDSSAADGHDRDVVLFQQSTSERSAEIVVPPVVDSRQSRSAAIITAPAVPPKLDRRAKRYRPPVAVISVPIAIARTQESEGIAAAVKAVPRLEPPSPETPSPKPQSIALVGAVDIKRVSLQISLADVRTLTIGSQLHDARVADPSVCKVVQAGANQLKLIGTGKGSTELLVVAEGKQSGQASRRQIFEINVSEKTDRSGVALAETAKLLNRSIAETFPNCQVLVRERAGELLVAGRCDSQTSAKKILRMIRKTCLVPVRDELIVP